MALLPVFVYVILLSFALGLALTPLARKLSFRLGVLDPVGPRKHHFEDMPLLGGLAIWFGFGLVVFGHVSLAILLRDQPWVRVALPSGVLWYVDRLENTLQPILGVLAAGTFVVILGLLDDIWGLSPWTRLAVQTLTAGAVVFAGVKPEFFKLHPYIVNGVAVVWIVGITNAFNLLDGLDGLSAGVGAITACILGAFLLYNGQPLVALFLFAFMAVLAGFLRYNFKPARIYLGSSGSMFIGFILGVTVLLAGFMTHRSTSMIPLIMPILVMGVPLYDTLSVMFIRIREGRSPLRPDRNHLAHRLLRIGMSERQTVLFMYLMSFCVGINATLLGGESVLLSVTILVQIIATFGLIILLERIYVGSEGSDLGRHTLPLRVATNGGAECAGVAAGLRGNLLLAFLDRLPDGELSPLLRGEEELAVVIQIASSPEASPVQALRSRCRLVGVEEHDKHRWLLRLGLRDLGPAELRELGKSLAGEGAA